MHDHCDHDHAPAPKLPAWAYSILIGAPGIAAVGHGVWHLVAHAFGLPCP